MGFVGATACLNLWAARMMIFIQRHEFCDKEKNIPLLYLFLPVLFCASLAINVQGTCRGLQRRFMLRFCAILGLIFIGVLSFISVGVC